MVYQLIGLIVLLMTTSVYSSTYECHRKICIPNIGQGTHVISVVNSERDFQEIDDVFTFLVKQDDIADRYLPLQASSVAELELQQRKSGTLISLNHLFPSFIAERFNRFANFSGPNCYNASLIASGILPRDELRYVSREELVEWLNLSFEEVSNPQSGDVVLFDPKGTMGHTAYYLFDDLIFQKKGMLKDYGYRIVKLENAVSPEVGEWTPGPLSGVSSTLDAQLMDSPVSYFRRIGMLEFDLSALSGRERAAIAILQHIKSGILRYGANWKIGKEMGLLTEHVVDDLINELSFLKQSSSAYAKLQYSLLISLRDQVFQSIEESEFSSPYASSDRINPLICYHKNDFTIDLIKRILNFYQKDISDNSIEKVFTYLDSLNKIRCKTQLLKTVKSL